MKIDNGYYDTILDAIYERQHLMFKDELKNIIT